MPKILAADKDSDMLGNIGKYLEKSGYRVITAGKSREAVKFLKNEAPSLVILDFTFPGTDGRPLFRSIRKISSVPVIVISESGDIADKITAFDAGADDYLVKPFDMRELPARIKAILRRLSMPPSDNDKTVTRGNMEINISNYELKIDSKVIGIPPKELELLYYFASNPDRVFTREQLLEQVWGFDHFGDLRTVDVHIKRLRTKIKKSSAWNIITVWGVGYKFAKPENKENFCGDLIEKR